MTARKRTYSPALDEQAKRLCLLFGATTDEVASALGVHPRTIEKWMRRYPSFRAAIEEGKAPADANVAMRLYQRAVGYEQEVEKAVVVGGRLQRIRVRERVAPDVVACIFWLKNRQRAYWYDASPRSPEPAGDPGATARDIVAALRAMHDADGLDADLADLAPQDEPAPAADLAPDLAREPGSSP